MSVTQYLIEANTAKEKYKQNLIDIDKLQTQNKQLQEQLSTLNEPSHETMWEVLKICLNNHLKLSPLTRHTPGITIEDCKLRLIIRTYQFDEIITWEIILPKEKHILSYWPSINVTNFHPSLGTRLNLDFVKYLEENEFLEIFKPLN